MFRYRLRSTESQPKPNQPWSCFRSRSVGFGGETTESNVSVDCQFLNRAESFQAISVVYLAHDQDNYPKKGYSESSHRLSVVGLYTRWTCRRPYTTISQELDVGEVTNEYRNNWG